MVIIYLYITLNSMESSHKWVPFLYCVCLTQWICFWYWFWHLREFWDECKTTSHCMFFLPPFIVSRNFAEAFIVQNIARTLPSCCCQQSMCTACWQSLVSGVADGERKVLWMWQYQVQPQPLCRTQWVLVSSIRAWVFAELRLQHSLLLHILPFNLSETPSILSPPSSCLNTLIIIYRIIVHTE